MPEPSTVNAPKKKMSGTSRSRLLNILLLIAVVVVALLFVRAEKQRRSIEQNLEKTSQELEQIKKATQNNGQEAANQVLANVRLLIDIPNEPAPTVATIVDVDALRKGNDFYKKANNGDNLIITADRAILYSPAKNMILDVVPVEINNKADASVSPAPKTSTSPAFSASPVP